ncbi:MAG: NSS family neurotransmitter:Na+ symporter [Gammaproteobacteria bacterium]|jgi:NSS family neurotransmitter:Na+ symporter
MSEPDKGFQWRSQSAFVLVAAGATLSLNDFLTLPALIGQNGGGSFLLLYGFFLFVMGMPLLVAELLLGRLGKADPSRTIEILAEQQKASVYWKVFGFLSMLAAFLVIAMFCVIAGWSLSYSIKSALGVYSGVTASGVGALFKDFVGDAERMMLWHTLFVVLLVSISAQPLKSGLEKALMILVPLMILLLMSGFLLASNSPEFTRSVEFLLNSDFSGFDSHTALLALQRAFYTLALGIGVMMMFGSYLPTNISIGYSAGLIIVFDLVFSIIIGLSLNTLIFTAGMEPAIENQFAFRALPYAFSQFQFGAFYGALFYLLLTLAALTTTLALMEAPVCYVQRKFHIGRVKAAIFIGIAVWLFGLGAVLSYSLWSGNGFTIALYFSGDAVRLVNNAGFHDVMVFFSSHLIQPLVALFLCIFAGWVLPRAITLNALRPTRKFWFELWNYLVRYVTPVFIFIVALNALGIV